MVGKITGGVFLLLFTFFIMPCSAAVTLSVSPVDGSNKLQFSKILPAGMENKTELHIRVTSSGGTRYQIFQRIVDPIVNEKGDVLNLQAIETQTLVRSNSYGTLYLQNTDHLNMGDQLLYSSSLNGDTDTFTVGYSLNQTWVNASGNFRGRIIFTVRGTNDNSSDQVIMDVVLQTTARLNLKIVGAQDPNRVTIQGTEDAAEKKLNFVAVSFSENAGGEIQIYQQLDSLPATESNEELKSGVLQFNVQGNSQGLRAQGVSALKTGRTLIYSGRVQQDNFVIYFTMDPALSVKQEAGFYKGAVKYVVQTDEGTKEFPINIQTDIAPIFKLTVTTPQQNGVSFSHILANTPPQDKEVIVTVLSNIHKPYQVMQDLQTTMTNEKGKEFDIRYINLRVQVPSDQTGQTDFVEFSPVKTGEHPVFSSDARGDAATFMLVYRIKGYSRMSEGTFMAPIRLSLNQK